MPDALLTPFWLEFAESNGPIGLGVTANDLDDAKKLIIKGGYGDFLLDIYEVHEAIDPLTLPDFVQKRMGPIVVRGLWYPVWQVAT